MDIKHYFYIARCNDGSLYSGATKNVEARINRHNQGKGGKYTRGRKPITLVYKEEFSSLLLARRRESEVKSWGRKKKEELIEAAGFPRPMASGLM
ncbi:MAG: GIY-YIG nuclease family protein [Candidatus Omnitrophota bacterium]